MVEQRLRHFNAILNFASCFVGAIMAIGAMLGAVNSLYAIIDGRLREFATLRAIGFARAPIMAVILCESVLLAMRERCSAVSRLGCSSVGCRRVPSDSAFSWMSHPPSLDLVSRRRWVWA